MAVQQLGLKELSNLERSRESIVVVENVQVAIEAGGAG